MALSFTKERNTILRLCYQSILKPIFFLNDPETVHDRMVHMGARLGEYGVTRWCVRTMFGYEHDSLKQKVLGIHFKNPIGLAAGFDKDADLTRIISSVGFGFIEIGSVTGNPCIGNPKPRLWRLKKSKGLVVYYGLKNKGAEVISRKLASHVFDVPVGTSVAMTNCADNLDTERAISDYKKAFQAFVSIGAYFTINISCPNAQGGQPFIEPSKLEALLVELDTVPTQKPVFIKLSPDLSCAQVDDILAVAKRHRVDGIICSNLTKKRNDKILDTDLPSVGGISGKPVQDLSDSLLSYIYQKEGKRFVLVGCGGVFTAEDAYRKITLGASLVQMITGMIFEGPQVISEINRGLVELLSRDGFASVSDAIGSAHRP